MKQGSETQVCLERTKSKHIVTKKQAQFFSSLLEILVLVSWLEIQFHFLGFIGYEILWKHLKLINV